jgi:hypothetical protein
MSHSKYARDLLDRFHMTYCKTTPTPFQSGVRLEDDGASPLVDSTRYIQLVWSLLYLTLSQPNVSYVVELVSRYMKGPHELQWKETKRIVIYFKRD